MALPLRPSRWRRWATACRGRGRRSPSCCRSRCRSSCRPSSRRPPPACWRTGRAGWCRARRTWSPSRCPSGRRGSRRSPPGRRSPPSAGRSCRARRRTPASRPRSPAAGWRRTAAVRTRGARRDERWGVIRGTTARGENDPGQVYAYWTCRRIRARAGSNGIDIKVSRHHTTSVSDFPQSIEVSKYRLDGSVLTLLLDSGANSTIELPIFRDFNFFFSEHNW